MSIKKNSWYLIPYTIFSWEQQACMLNLDSLSQKNAKAGEAREHSKNEQKRQHDRVLFAH